MHLAILFLSLVAYSSQNLFPLKVNHAPGFELNMKKKGVLSEIPAEVIKPCLDPEGKIADVNEDWSFSDHRMLGDVRPRTHLKDACKLNDQKWQLVCESGGYAITEEKYEFTLIAGHWQKSSEESGLKLKTDCKDKEGSQK